MATLSATNPTLLDLKNSLDPDGSPAAVLEILHQVNDVLADMTVLEGNLTTGHRSVIRTGLSNGTWRKLNEGVQPSKAETEQITDTCALLEAYDEVDAYLANLGGNPQAFRLNNAVAKIEGMSQQVAEAIFYGNAATNPGQFTGLAPRYNSLSAANADNIIDAGGTGSDNRSIWICNWSPMSLFMIYPRGTEGGLQVTDKGLTTVEDADGSNGRMEAYRMHYRWSIGLVVADWRQVVRICNIDKSLLSTDASTGANLPELLFQGMELFPRTSFGRKVVYMSRDVATKFRQQLASATKQSTLEYANVGGIRTATWNELAIRRVDRLAVDEARVT